MKHARGRRMPGGDVGFTLMELLVVVLVVGLLAGISVPVYLSQRAKAADASVKADLKNVATAVEGWTAAHPDDRDGPATPGAPVSNYEGGVLEPSLRIDPDTAVPTSPGNYIEVYAHSDGTGFCVAGASTSGKRPWKLPNRPNPGALQVYDSTAGGLTPMPSMGCAYGNRLPVAPYTAGSGTLPCPQLTRVRVQFESGLSWRVVLDTATPPPAGAGLYHSYYQNNAYGPFSFAYGAFAPGSYTRHTSGGPGWTRVLGVQYRAADGRVSTGCTQGFRIEMPEGQNSFEAEVVSLPPTP